MILAVKPSYQILKQGFAIINKQRNIYYIKILEVIIDSLEHVNKMRKYLDSVTMSG